MSARRTDGEGGVAASAYDGIAAWYDAWVDGPMEEDPYFREARALMGEIAGQRICDLACGQGRVARYLAEHGARVVGIDSSGKLLDIARRHESDRPLGIDYRQADARTLPGVEDGAFDGVICSMALMDIADLAPTLQSVARILTPGGWFVFSILHPCYNTARSGEVVTSEGAGRFVGAYFTEGWWRSDTRTGPPGKVGAYHRTLSSYVNALTEVGLVLERMREVQATGELAEKRPVWAEVPAVLVARCSRRAAG